LYNEQKFKKKIEKCIAVSSVSIKTAIPGVDVKTIQCRDMQKALKSNIYYFIPI
jgi:hypothetical protein